MTALTRPNKCVVNFWNGRGIAERQVDSLTLGNIEGAQAYRRTHHADTARHL